MSEHVKSTLPPSSVKLDSVTLFVHKECTQCNDAIFSLGLDWRELKKNRDFFSKVTTVPRICLKYMIYTALKAV